MNSIPSSSSISDESSELPAVYIVEGLAQREQVETAKALCEAQGLRVIVVGDDAASLARARSLMLRSQSWSRGRSEGMGMAHQACYGSSAAMRIRQLDSHMRGKSDLFGNSFQLLNRQVVEQLTQSFFVELKEDPKKKTYGPPRKTGKGKVARW